jgi:hypothetical protein
VSLLSQRRFAGGELAPALHSGVDLLKYATGLKTAKNVFIGKNGGVSNRPGTKFIGEVLNTTSKARLIPAVFGEELNSVAVMQKDMLYFLFGDVFQGATFSITGITKASPGVVTFNTTPTSSVGNINNIADGDWVFISGVGGMTEVDGWYTVDVTGSTLILKNFTTGVDINTTSFSTYTSGGTIRSYKRRPFTFVESRLFDYRWAQYTEVTGFYARRFAFTHPEEKHVQYWTDVYHNSGFFTYNVFGPPTFDDTVTISGGAGTAARYVVTKVRLITGEESLPSSVIGSASATPTLTLPTAADGFVYNIYKRSANYNVYGFLGQVDGGNYVDSPAGTPDYNSTPPLRREPFGTYSVFGAAKPISIPDTPGDYPSVVGFFQQRMVLGASSNNPNALHLSKVGCPYNFSESNPGVDSDPVSFYLTGKVSQQIKHVVDIGRLVVFTDQGEWVIEGDNGVITPTAINPKQYSYNGSSELPPLVVDSNVLYVQARGNIVRDFSYDFQVDGYQGNELSLFSSHLFEGYQIVDWAFQKVPHSIVWAIRDDGVLLSLTYVREHQIWGWTKHDTDGAFESVAVIPGELEDNVYFVVKRTIDGVEKRYIERLHTRDIDDVTDAIFMDSSLSYDGTNTGSTTMTISGGTNWTSGESLTLTASASFFAAGDVGNEIHMSDGLRLEIVGYTSATVVTVIANKTVPVALRSTATASWGKAVDELSGLSHLEGKAVSVFADGFVVASPNNPSLETLTVTSGAITLPECHVKIHVGLPYISDIETLDIDSPSGESLANKKTLVTEAFMHVFETRGLWVGTEEPTSGLNGLSEILPREVSDGYDDPPPLKTEVVDVKIRGDWKRFGGVFIRQVDPLPMTINSIMPSGFFPIRG